MSEGHGNALEALLEAQAALTKAYRYMKALEKNLAEKEAECDRFRDYITKHDIGRKPQDAPSD